MPAKLRREPTVTNRRTVSAKENDLLNDENGRKRTYKTYSADRRKYIYINLQTVESPGRLNATPAGTLPTRRSL